MTRFSPSFTALLLGGAFLVVAAVPAPAADQKKVQAYSDALKNGQDAEKKEDWVRAAKAYTEMVQLAPAVGLKNWDDQKEAEYYFNKIGKYYARAEQFEEGDAALRKSLAFYEKKKDGARSAAVHNELGKLNRDWGRYRQAEEDLKEAVRLWRDQADSGLRLAESLETLALVYVAVYRFDDARTHFNEAFTILRKEETAAGAGPRANEVKQVQADCLNNSASILWQEGDFAQATLQCEEALKIYQKLGDRLKEATCHQNLGWVAFRQGQYSRAEQSYKKAQEIRKEQLPPHDTRVVQTACGLGLVYLTRREADDLDKARVLYKRTSEGLGDNLREHPDRARLFHGMGDLYQAVGKPDEALKSYQQARSVWQAVARRGERSTDEALTLGRLAWLAQAEGKYANAETLYRDALDLRLKKLAADHPDVAMSQDNLAGLFAKQGRWREAAEQAEPARKTVHHYVRHLLPVQPEEVQLSFLRAQNEDDLHAALSIGWAQRTDPNLAQTTAGWLVNSKGLVHETLAERGILERDKSDPTRAKLVERLTEVRRRLSALTFGDISSGQLDGRRKEMEKLGSEEQELTKQLFQGGGRRPQGDNWVNLEDIRKALPRDAVLLEVVRLREWGFQVKGTERVWLPDRYVAWLIPAEGRGSVSVVGLGDAAATDKAVQGVRDAFELASHLYQSDPSALGTKKSEQEIRRPLQALADLILKPMAGELQKYNHLIIGGDGDLWLVPWAALPYKDGYLIEQFQVSSVITGRDLVSKRTAPEPTAPVVFADPNYDLGGSGAPAPASSVRRLFDKVKRLDNSRSEAEGVIPSLNDFTGKKTRWVYGNDATKEAFKKVERPEVLFVSTHGFAFGEKDGEVLKLLNKDPWLRSGLVFAGYNRSEDDGILTAKEILGMDLRGTRLVALSACQTGLGKVVRGDGVRGLHQAFQLAGAKTVLATLWSVPDEETSALTRTLFGNLAKNKSSVAAALRQAQRDKIIKDREEFGSTHPFYWGAFTVTGIDK
jgi:CHAT domain-containing protein/tetratricopeptide (TPR) repeat protein